jgi:hypothetical protein
MTGALTALLEQADYREGNYFSRYDLEEMGMGSTLPPFLRPATTPQMITCPGCEEVCTMPYQKQNGKGFIWCDRPQALGRIDLQARDLEYWRVELQALAQWLADELELQPIREIIPRRAFEIGIMEGHALFLLRGMDWPDAADIYADSRISNAQPLLITLAPVPKEITLPALWIGQMLRQDASGLALDKERLLHSLHHNTPQEGNLFRRNGDFWRVRYEGKEALIKHSNGMVYLDHLLHHPNEEVPALLLQGLTNKAVLDALPVDEEYRESASLGGDVIADKQAIEAAKVELERLRKRNPDAPEILKLETYLKQAAYKGKSRKFVDDNEKARLAVTKAVKVTLQKMEQSHPSLYKHLRLFTLTGAHCHYKIYNQWG